MFRVNFNTVVNDTTDRLTVFFFLSDGRNFSLNWVMTIDNELERQKYKFAGEGVLPGARLLIVNMRIINRYLKRVVWMNWYRIQLSYRQPQLQEFGCN